MHRLHLLSCLVRCPLEQSAPSGQQTSTLLMASVSVTGRPLSLRSSKAILASLLAVGFDKLVAPLLPVSWPSIGLSSPAGVCSYRDTGAA